MIKSATHKNIDFDGTCKRDFRCLFPGHSRKQGVAAQSSDDEIDLKWVFHSLLGSVYTKHQHQRCDDACDSVLIENSRVT